MPDRTACVLVIGNEVLSGRTRDANIPMIATGLAGIGIAVKEARIIPDVHEAIVSALHDVRDRFDLVFTTGGIGPTHDDITAEAVSAAFGVELEQNPDAVKRLRDYYGPEHLTPARLRMARIPAGAALLDNPVSAAPGFCIGNVYVLAGVPRIATACFDLLKPGLAGGAAIVSRAVSAAVRESDLAVSLGGIQASFPDVDIGSYPFMTPKGYGVSIVARGTDPERLDQVAAVVADAMRALGVEPFFADHAAAADESS
ncbi:competence/damage-inducible protein A [Haematospirillum sp. H1815]|uniref:competence/damage-inducible protein A n=1 Tax=Haematospirillum sp. H1815 TaxID=2723108 RepID=UPI0014389893|nr:molybdopterin-binding protein [Haematospirillum sp. H1815]NKD77735.1 competence/damage-inducible protein A [Haematospirillum sp. H1815]